MPNYPKTRLLQEQLTLAKWYEIEHLTEVKSGAESPSTDVVFACFFGRALTVSDLDCIRDFFNQKLLSNVELALYQPVATLPAALAVTFPKGNIELEKASLRQFARTLGLQAAYLNTRVSLDKPGLLVMDMDSTAITIECIDEIARLADVYDEVASVTQAAMQGELSFADSLHQRVSKLQGIPLSLILPLKENLPLMPGIEDLCKALKAANWRLAIASGGFTWFAEALKEPLNLDHFFANTLSIADEKLTGEVLGEVVDAQKKAEILRSLAKQYHIESSQCVAIGDGANDLAMMAQASLGVSIHGKPKVVEQADAAICEGSVAQLLYFLTLPQK